jgi:cell division septation protein DedD
MIMQTKRFRFDNKYLIGSAAVIAGFGGIMTLFVHFAPLNVPNANIATIPEVPKSQEVKTESADTSQTNTQAQPTGSTTKTSSPVLTPTRTASSPVVTDNGSTTSPASPVETTPVVSTPTMPEVSTPPVTEEPETPAPTLPDVPIIGPILDPLLP